MSASSVPIWHSLRASHGPTSRYSSNPRSDLLSLLNHEVARVLDLGCGSGATGRLLKTQYPQAHVIGIEQDPQTAEAARQFLDEVLTENLDKLNFANLGWDEGSLDVVIAGDVLEHLFNPWVLLERLRPYLSENCQLLISVPNVANAWVISHLAHGRWEYETEGLLDFSHVRFFTRTTVDRLLSETGYRVETLLRSMDDRVPPWPHGPEVTACDLEIGSMVFKGMTSARWNDMRTLQYLLRARPLRQKVQWPVGALDDQLANFTLSSERLGLPVLKVAVLSTDLPEWACAEIRLRTPFQRLNGIFELLWVLKYDDRGTLVLDREMLDSADMVVVQRLFPSKSTIDVLNQVKESGKPFIYEIDDLLTCLPKASPYYESIKLQRPYIEKCIRDANMVIVSTEVLKNAYTSLNPNIEVRPNYLDESLWQPTLPTRESVARPLRILYAGTPTHHEDLSFILPTLERLKSIHGEAIRFVFMGMSPPPDNRLGEVEFLAFEPDYRAYVELMRRVQIDLAVVPLVDNTFNRAKSAIKWLEYASLGVPAVFSDLPPYEVVEHGRTGMRVANKENAWYEAINSLIDSPQLCKQIGEAAKEEVLQNWTLAYGKQEVARLFVKAYSMLSEQNESSNTPQGNFTMSTDVPLKELKAVLQDRCWAQSKLCNVEAKFAIIVRGGQGDDMASADTEESLASQWAKPYRVQTAVALGLEDLNRLTTVQSSDWVLFLQAGDICEPELIARLTLCVDVRYEWELIYIDEATIGEDGSPINWHYKPEFNLDLLRSIPYTGVAFAVRRSLFEALGGFDTRCEGIEEYDLMFRAFERLGASGIGHLSGALISHKPNVVFSQRPLPEVLEAGRQALSRHLDRLGVPAEVEYGNLLATYRVRYVHADKPLISIIIPTRNQRELLSHCVQSIFAHTAWPNFELLVVNNGSDEPDAVEFLKGLAALGAELKDRIRVLDYPHAFNYSAMNNVAASEAFGEYLLLLNNDIQALHPEWLDVMMSHAQRPEVGVVGAKLLYPDGKVQHAGVIMGMKGPAEHPFIGHEAKDPGYYGRLQVDQNYSAVTGACLLVRRSLFEAVGGLDEDELAVSYSDIDLCMKVREQGYLIVWTPHAILMHEGSKSQKTGVEALEDKAKVERFSGEQAVMYRRWLSKMANDPAYNRYLSLSSTEFEVEKDEALHWDPEWRPVPRIICHPADRMGCGEYRILSPARALVNAGRIQGVESERIYTPPELARIRPDAVVLQRQVEPHQIEAIERHKRFNDLFCVFEIDDLVTNVPIKNAHKKHLPKDLYKRLRRAARLCDRLVVATEPLAEAYSDLCGDVRIVPNYIEEARWGDLSPKRHVGSKPRVGWAGGVSHTGDLELIVGVVEALKDEVEWVFLGMCPERLRPFVHEFHQPVEIDQYPRKLASLNLDLAIAPLEDLPFNHAKSHLRLLEYGILGYPVVCSNLTPYQGAYPVTRVRNRFRDWADAIQAHLEDPDSNAAQGDALRRYVRENWLLERNLDVWLDGWLP